VVDGPAGAIVQPDGQYTVAAVGSIAARNVGSWEPAEVEIPKQVATRLGPELQAGAAALAEQAGMGSLDWAGRLLGGR
jgi:hypothetical protein